MQSQPTSPETGTPTLRGRRGWLISDGKAGMVVQVRGVADALGLDYTMKTVELREP